MAARASPPIHMQRIEDLTKAGVPDVYAICKGRSTWLELKAARAYPKRNDTPVLGARGLLQEQKNWHLTHSANGGSVCTLIGVGSYDYYLIGGAASDLVNGWCATELTFNAICYGSAPKFWIQLADFLLKGKE